MICYACGTMKHDHLFFEHAGMTSHAPRHDLLCEALAAVMSHADELDGLRQTPADDRLWVLCEQAHALMLRNPANEALRYVGQHAHELKSWMGRTLH